jgi:cardiolipin synthase (CMP-forming)
VSKPRLKDSTKLLRERLTALNKNENIYTLPNFLTLSRFIAAPIVGYLVLHDQHLYAVALFAYAGITDLVDGWIARRWNLQTVIGTVVDPMADKALMTILVVCLAIKGALPRKYCLTDHSLPSNHGGISSTRVKIIILSIFF